jgi:hypothetical protein
MARGFEQVEGGACAPRGPTGGWVASTLLPAALLACGLAASPLASAQTVAPSSVPPTPAPVAEKSPWDAAEPWRTDRFYFQTSIYTAHFHPSDEHDNHSYLANLEYRFDKSWLEGQWIAGGASFKNSFGQWCQYLYGGLLWRPFVQAQPLYFKLTAGLLHGYKEPYQDKIPFNSDNGFAPAILPSMGYCYDRYCTELIVYGAAGLMLTVGVTLP